MATISHADLKLLIKTAKGMVVEDMIQEESVNILIGDSGLGKTPFLIQLGLCVAAGIPFLGLAVRQGPVIFADYEFCQAGSEKIITAISQHLGLESIPESFRMPGANFNLLQAIKEVQPVLVIIDSLRAYNPNMEKDNTSAAGELNTLHKIAKNNHCAFLLLHHVRKTDQKEPPESLHDSNSVMDWLQQASGARSLINQTDGRFGLEAGYREEIDLLMRGHFKLKGEVGPWPICRILDDEGEPLGYSRVTGKSLLSPGQRTCYDKLPPTFTWKEAEKLLFDGHKGGKALSLLTQRAMAAGILIKQGDKKAVHYKKI